MPTKSNKHSNAQRIFYSSFDGGLNLSVPSESMAKNELKEALNVEFSHATGSMRVRGGLIWSGEFEKEIDFVIPVPGNRGFLARVKGSKTLYYFLWNNIFGVQGELTGTGDISAVTFGETGELIIASGGKLQKFSSEKVLPKLTVLNNSPSNSRLVFVRNGRLGVVDGTDTIKFSSVGDASSWDNDPDDESSAQFVEIGYKDGMDIDAVIPLSRDLIIFKSPPEEPDKGIIWRLTGDFPEIAVLELAHNTGTFSMRSVKAVGNDVFFVSPSGIATLSSVTSYGEIKTSYPDRKISTALTPKLTDTSQLWDVPLKQQLWILPSSEEKIIWVFDYTRNIWTQFEFPQIPVHVTGVDNQLFIFMGKDLYNLSEDYVHDEIKGGENPEVKEITAHMKLGTLLTGGQTLIKGAFASFDVKPECYAELKLSKFIMPFRAGGAIDYIYDAPNDTQYAYEDDDSLFPDGNVLTSRRKFIVREWAVSPEINFIGGGSSISTIGIEMLEV